MSTVARWSRFLTALSLAVVILLVGVGLSRAGVIRNESDALWPTYDLLHVDTLRGGFWELWFPFSFHVTFWTVILYGVFSLAQALRQRR